MKIYVRYILLRLLIGCCNLLPQRFLYFIALRLADLNYFWLDRKGREAVEANLRHALPGATEARIANEARWIFRNFGKYLTEFFRFRHFDAGYFQTHMAYKGKEHVDGALAGGKGCIVASAHFSNWELGAAGLVFCGHRVTVSVAMHRYGRINDLFMRERESVGLNVADMEKDAAKKMMRALQRNELVGVMGDRDPTSQGIEVMFFGRPCRFPQGPARMAIATGAPVVPAFCLLRSNDSFLTVFHPPLAVPGTGDRGERARALTQAFADVFADVIRMFPEQWAAFYPIWDADWRPE